MQARILSVVLGYTIPEIKLTPQLAVASSQEAAHLNLCAQKN